jgi:hypothetical protein
MCDLHRYEELVERPEAIMRDIIVNRLKLEWEPAVLDFHNNHRTVQTHSQSRKRLRLCALQGYAWCTFGLSIRLLNTSIWWFVTGS